MRLVLVVLIALATGCLEAETVQCASGLLCPAGFVCSDDDTSCLGPQTCGNRIVEGSEACDDGNQSDGDSCSSDCLSVTICGDGRIGSGETCDEGLAGASLSGDGCSSSCATETLTWAPIEAIGDAPPARHESSAVYLPQRGTTLLFGGRLSGTLTYGDTWEWNGASWNPIAVSPSPPPRFAHSMAWDGSRILLYGGLDGSNTERGDTWLWDGESWTEYVGTPAPPPRDRASMVYDSTRKKIFLFGGAAGLTRKRDLWMWDGESWAEVPQSSPWPSAREGASMAYDPARERVVLWGGSNNTATPFDDTWEWDGTQWEDLSAAPAPPLRALGTLVFLANRLATVLFGGLGLAAQNDTWAWDGEAWGGLVPTTRGPERYLHAAAYRAVDDRMEVFGGIDNTGDAVALDTVWTARITAGGTADDCRSAIDGDGDGAAGCDDPDCWPYCTPECPPRTTGEWPNDCDKTVPHCGDGECNQLLETVELCPIDCP